MAAVVRRLRARQDEIEQAVFARVREAVPESAGDPDSEYVRGLRVAVAAAVEFGLAGLEQGDRASGAIPAEAVAQAQLAARSGVSLEAVLRRYIAGHALLWDYVMSEADHMARAGQASGLREMSRAQAALLDRLVVGVTREHVAELQRAERSREHRLLKHVQALLAGEDPDRGAGAPRLDYDLDGEHLALIARGTDARDAVRELAASLDRRLLNIAYREETTWAWLGGTRALDMRQLQRLAVSGELSARVTLATGEPGRGFAGWQLSHQQAQAALLVATRRPRPLTRYGDVALLAATLKDHALARALTDVYLTPLDDTGYSDSTLLKTLHAYIKAERNSSSAANALGVARSTVLNRLRTIEERLGRTLHQCPELEVALTLADLNDPTITANPSITPSFT